MLARVRIPETCGSLLPQPSIPETCKGLHCGGNGLCPPYLHAPFPTLSFVPFFPSTSFLSSSNPLPISRMLTRYLATVESMRLDWGQGNDTHTQTIPYTSGNNIVHLDTGAGAALQVGGGRGEGVRALWLLVRAG